MFAYSAGCLFPVWIFSVPRRRGAMPDRTSCPSLARPCARDYFNSPNSPQFPTLRVDRGKHIRKMNPLTWASVCAKFPPLLQQN